MKRIGRLIEYGWLLASLWLRIVAARCGAFVEKHTPSLRRLIIVFVAAAAGVLAVHFGGTSLQPGALSGYLIAVAAMIGGAIAIIFSISISLVQGVASLYTSKHFEEYTNDWRGQQAIYVIVIVITLVLFGAGIYVGSLTFITGLVKATILTGSMVLIGAVFALIDRQYELVRQRIGPTSVIRFLKQKAERLLSDSDRNARQLARLLSIRNPSVAPYEILAQAFASQASLGDVNRQTDALVELSLKLADREDGEASKLALDAMGSIVASYFGLRKTSSLIQRSLQNMLAQQSDSHTFISINCERLNTAGRKFIVEGRQDLSEHVVTIYGAITSAAADVVHAQQPTENPILDQVIAYLNFHLDAAASAKDEEVPFQGVRLLGAIGIKAASTGLSSTQFAIHERLLRLTMIGLGLQSMPIVEVSIDAFMGIIKATFASSRISRPQPIETTLTDIADVVIALDLVNKAAGLQNDPTRQFLSIKAYTDLSGLFGTIDAIYEQIEDDGERRTYRYNLIVFFEALRTSLRRVAEGVKSCDTLLAGSIGRLLFIACAYICDLMEREDFTDVRFKLYALISTLVYTPYFFAKESPTFDAASNAFGDLIDPIAKIGIISLDLPEGHDIIKACISSISSISEQAIDKSHDEYGYAEPHIFVRACYLGILALKRGWTDVVSNLKEKIEAFDGRFAMKHLANPPSVGPSEPGAASLPIFGLVNRDQLLREVQGFQSGFDYNRLNRSGIGNHSEDMMYALVDAADIERFIEAMWPTESYA